ncbi:LANO_0C07734g1_1 [Lachancea nothofagi CBS 11611]|uniref:LANO_0C07734g1_1 n=1 Tax=Lachancea nothofagi CBS 11611 TaxID=1266666 RepID=A0A1G4J8W9_9SACH|nr:LANO_0C07734g1_1 [Lachancea nothofagi CBS 11611]
MVKSYQRFEQDSVLGVISSNSNCLWVPSQNRNASGQVLTGALENVNCWSIKSGELVGTLSDGFPPGAVDAQSSKPAESAYLQYHPDTNLLAVGYNDGMIKIWDLLSRSVLMKFNGHKSAITMLRFDHTGTRLISGSKDSDIVVWDLVGEVGLYKLRSHKDSITGIWCQGEEWLISTSKDGLIKVWDLKTQQCVETHMAHVGECWSLGVHEDLVVTASADNQLKLWKLDLEQEPGHMLVEKGVHEKQSKQRGVAIEFVTVNEAVTFFFVQNADRTTEVFRLRTSEEMSKALKKREKRLIEKGLSSEDIEKNLSESFCSFVMHPFQVLRSTYKIKAVSWATTTTSKLELAVTTANNTVDYYSIPYHKRDPTTQSPTKLYSIDIKGHRTDVRAIDISDDGKLLATASNGSLKIWNMKTSSCIRTFECGYALSCKFLPGGALVVLGSRSGELQLFDLASSTLLSTETVHTGAIWSLDITSDGKKLVTGSADKTVCFWEFQVEQELIPGSVDKFVPKLKLFHDTTLELNDDILAVKISPDDKLLAVSLLDNTVKVFFLDSKKFFLSLYGHKLPVLSIDISFDSKLLITSSADKNIKIWGLDFGDCHKSLFAHNDSIMKVCFVPESHNFFSCSKDNLVKYWDGDKFECIQKLAAHQKEVWTLAVSADARTVVSASHDQSIRVWRETEDQVFIEEERERESDEQYEQTLLNSLEDGNADDMFRKDKNEEGGITDEVTDVHKQTIESLKASERLVEAIDLGMSEVNLLQEHEKAMKLWQKKKSGPQPGKPQPNSILLAVQKSPLEYIMDVLIRIRPSQLEDALLVLPFSYVLTLLQYIDLVVEEKTIVGRRLPLICRVLFFIIKSNHRELFSQKNEELKIQIDRIKLKLRSSVQSKADDLGFNLQGLKFIKQQWNLKHNFDFTDDVTKSQKDNKVKKRVFETLV